MVAWPSAHFVSQSGRSALRCELCSQATADEQSSLEEAADAVQVEAVGIPSITPEQLQNSMLFDGFPFSKGQEVINARAAMAGFVAAVVSEVATQKSVWVQIAGRCVARISFFLNVVIRLLCCLRHRCVPDSLCASCVQGTS